MLVSRDERCRLGENQLKLPLTCKYGYRQPEGKSVTLLHTLNDIQQGHPSTRGGKDTNGIPKLA
jgi:hypothetical protein